MPSGRASTWPAFVWISLDLDSLVGRVERVEAGVDGEGLGPVEGLPRRFFVRTDEYPEGEHTVSVAGLPPRPGPGGSSGWRGAPAIVLTVPLVFDQRPPTPVAGHVGPRSRATGRGVRWGASDDANFYAYLVVRHAPWSETVGGFGWLPVVDTPLRPERDGSTSTPPSRRSTAPGADYDVRVWNRRGRVLVGGDEVGGVRGVGPRAPRPHRRDRVRGRRIGDVRGPRRRPSSRSRRRTTASSAGSSSRPSLAPDTCRRAST